MATVTREREEQEEFDAQMRLLQRAARHCDKREDDDAAEACRWAASRMQHEHAAALAAPPAEVGCERSDGTLNLHPASEVCEVCSPRVAAAQAPPASDPPGLVALVREYQALINGYGDGEQKLQELDDRLAVVQEQLLAYPLPASPQAETTKGDE